MPVNAKVIISACPASSSSCFWSSKCTGSMSLTAQVPITREEPRVSPEELPKSEPQARDGCWHQSARLRRWKERTSVSRTSQAQPPHAVVQLPHPVAQPTERLWPLMLPACRGSVTSSQSIWLSRTPRTRQGEQSFLSRWMMSSTMQLAAAGVASVAACSSYGITFFGVLLNNISYHLHFV